LPLRDEVSGSPLRHQRDRAQPSVDSRRADRFRSQVPMKILLIGSGGREHAIAWRLKQDIPSLELFIAPANAGTTAHGTNLPIGVTDLDALVKWATENKPDLTVVGPEAPLCAGVVDRFEQAGLPIFGPNKAAANLEGSKVFTKTLLLKHN